MSPRVCPRPNVQESLFLWKLGPMGFYYRLAYRWFNLGEWVCFPLLVVFTVGWECFSFRPGSHGVLWFLAFRPFFSPCSFLPIVAGEGFFVKQGQRVFDLGIVGWTVVGGFGLDDLHSGQQPIVPSIVG